MVSECIGGEWAGLICRLGEGGEAIRSEVECV